MSEKGLVQKDVESRILAWADDPAAADKLAEVLVKHLESTGMTPAKILSYIKSGDLEGGGVLKALAIGLLGIPLVGALAGFGGVIGGSAAGMYYPELARPAAFAGGAAGILAGIAPHIQKVNPLVLIRRAKIRSAMKRAAKEAASDLLEADLTMMDVAKVLAAHMMAEMKQNKAARKDLAKWMAGRKMEEPQEESSLDHLLSSLRCVCEGKDR